ncbi:50S ribosomal protein L4 [Bombilactobacillus mellis]|uniref:50S ribosomal protein L4 n=1 Tax=Bombilactobacillus mellis TaxID=1218508 RepID=UPI0015802C38|nr:50S ribosomal protein L4 [Bombilactobacillus mellis]MBI0106777.1 50S ribosomal protein L4 [Lactobacillus sp. W8086]MBI0108241.1 50S ribosomal protein L4 [Lactobacillus sp. W8085]MBI0111459.1 50S ribosomal protein L4 [Lactobacillus sp. W8088]MBI0115174.1 50S ribosomal protein L4 [Lactobacillus sp. W8087]MBI0118899.1 50S ribosomal protein L4 [Lactobacillus sp. W8089]MBI0130864.1 50S ribosomal protein L4 [Lactobacillus sp. W8090]
MTQLDVYQQTGTKNGTTEVKAEVFGIEPNNHVVADAVIMQQASLRRGTHAVKNRSAVRGGGRKPWRQKGTGRARQGSIRAPQWRGGGVVFGPTPRSYAYKLPRKVARLALKSVLSQKVADQEMIVVDSLDFDKPSTKAFKQLLDKLEAQGRTLVVVESGNDNAILSARNIDKVKAITVENVNVLDVINNQQMIVTQKALAKIEEALG